MNVTPVRNGIIPIVVVLLVSSACGCRTTNRAKDSPAEYDLPSVDISAHQCFASVERVANIGFARDSAVVGEEHAPTLERVRAWMDAYAGRRLVLEGHTCNIGSASYNLARSRRRAEAVRAALVDRGIAPERFTIKALGASAPVAPYDPESIHRNRCVIFQDAGR